MIAGTKWLLAPDAAEASNPSRNRTWSDSFEDCHAIQHTHESCYWSLSYKSRRLGSHQHDLLYKSSVFLNRATSAWCRISSPTRNRTRNFWLEARGDFRFTIEPFANKRKARESNPHHPKVARVSSAARQTVSGCLP